MKKLCCVFLLLVGLLLSTSLTTAETIYTRYFESIDGDLRSEVLRVYSVTALQGEKVTIVAYGLEEGMAPAITALDTTGMTIAEDLNPEQEDVALVQFTATADGIHPFIVYRQTGVEGLVRIMVFEGDPLNDVTSILDTIDPLLPSRAYILAGSRMIDDDERPVEFSIESLPFPPVAGAEDEELPQPQFFASRATYQNPPAIEERLTPISRFDWQNRPDVQLYTLNIRPVPENQDSFQQEVFSQDGIEIPTLEQPLVPYDIVLSVKPGLPTPIRLERPFCTGSLPVVGRNLIVQNIPGEAYVQIGTISGGEVVEIIGTDSTGNYIQITWDAALSGSGWVQYDDIFEIGTPECVRVVPVEENTAALEQALQEKVEEIIEELEPEEVAIQPTPQPTLEVTPPPAILDVQITNAVDNPTPPEGSTVNFTIAVGNFSTDLIVNAQVNVSLPVGLTFAGFSEQCIEGSVFPICILGDIPAGEVHGFVLSAVVDPNTLGQTLTTVAETSAGGLLIQAPAAVTVSAPLNQATPIPPTVDLSITKTVDDPTPVEQQTITFTITASNNGPDGAGDIAVTDQLPAGLSYVGSTLTKGTYDPNTGVWYLGIMQTGESATLTIQARVTGTYLSTITNIASINAPQINDPNTSNNTASLPIKVDCIAGGIGVAASDTTGLINTINQANSNPDHTTICLTNSTYTLTTIAHTSFYGTTGLPAITSSMQILGNNATILRASSAPEFSNMVIDMGNIDVTLQNLTISGGGIGVYSFNGSLTITGSTITNNFARGIAVNVNDLYTLTISDSVISDNAGGGIFLTTGGLPVLTVSINNTIIRNNTTPGDGGGIYYLPALGFARDTAPALLKNMNSLRYRNMYSFSFTINGSTISGNSAGGDGGGVMNGRDIIFNNTTISGNHADGNGGGIHNLTGTINLQNSSNVASNTSNTSGGGIFNGSTTTISNSTLSGNSAVNDAGGIWNAGAVTLTNSTVSNNTSSNIGGGITNVGTLTVTNSTLSGNSAGTGGGIFNDNSATLTINNSTLSGNNSTVHGGGISNKSVLTMTNSTLSGNSTGSWGGGIYNEGNSLVSNSTISMNSAPIGGGIWLSGPIIIKNSIIANSSGGGDCAGGPTAQGVNLDSDGTCAGFTNSPTINLGPLANNGGATQTHAIDGTSSANNAALDCTDTGGSQVISDQRGVGRGFPVCDVGAYEFP